LLVGLITLAVVAAYQAVGSLLVVGMLLGPAVAAGRWATRIPTPMAPAAVVGTASVAIGLLISWHAGPAAGATIAFVAIAAAAISTVIHHLLIDSIPGRRAALAERTA